MARNLRLPASVLAIIGSVYASQITINAISLFKEIGFSSANALLSPLFLLAAVTTSLAGAIVVYAKGIST